MKILKKVVYGFPALLLAAPLLAFAQFVTPTDTGLPSGTIVKILTNGMNWLLYIVGILGVIGFVIAGILYLTAAGDDDQIKRAKKAMVFSIIGVVVALIGVVVINAVKGILSANNTGI
jgi:hypothetical protein